MSVIIQITYPSNDEDLIYSPKDKNDAISFYKQRHGLDDGDLEGAEITVIDEDLWELTYLFDSEEKKRFSLVDVVKDLDEPEIIATNCP